VEGLDPLLRLLESSPVDCVSLPVEAFASLSKHYESCLTKVAHLVTPRLLVLFQQHHSEGTGSLEAELISLFKVWSKFELCQDLFCDTFLPFIKEIIEKYFK